MSIANPAPYFTGLPKFEEVRLSKAEAKAPDEASEKDSGKQHDHGAPASKTNRARGGRKPLGRPSTVKSGGEREDRWNVCTS